MASCKHIRWCASLLNGARGRGFSTESLGGTSGELLAALQSHVNESGQYLFSILRDSLRDEREVLLRLLENEKVMREKEKEMREVLLQLLEKEKELRANEHIDLLRARGLNDTRGLFEWIQEDLAGKSNITLWLKGADLWEAILKANAGMATCIKNCTRVPVSNVAKQALSCYNVFSILSQHVHAGKSLAELQIAQGGTIMFERGPLSSEQVQVLLCMGAAARVKIEENTASRTRCF